MKSLQPHIAITLILSQLLWGAGFAYAQETATDTSVVLPVEEVVVPVTETNVSTPTDVPVETPPPPITVTEEEGSTVTQSATSTEILQQTFGEQDPVDPTDVPVDTPVEIATTTEETLPDESATSTDPLPDATSTDPVATTTDPADETPLEIIPPEPTPEPVSESNPEPSPEQPPIMNEPSPRDEYVFTIEDTEPEPEYVFSVNSGKSLPTKRKVKHESRDRFNRLYTTVTEETLTNAPQVSADNVTGTMQISSSCSNKYYVVLVYKNPGDYERDRSSYIVNRAYECLGGSFTYELSELPSTLTDGTYYVLIGEQGDTGTWLPISALTEVIINRNTQ